MMGVPEAESEREHWDDNDARPQHMVVHRQQELLARAGTQ